MRQEEAAAATAGVTVRPTASATAVGDPGALSPYWGFHQAVAEGEVAALRPREGLPAGRHRGTRRGGGRDRGPARPPRGAGGRGPAPSGRPPRRCARGPG